MAEQVSDPGLPVQLGYSRNRIPVLKFFVEDKPTFFLVDTGTPFTAVSLRQVETWGLAHKIQRCDNGYFYGTVTAELLHSQEEYYQSTEAYIIAKDFRFHVMANIGGNLLGLDFLTSARCVLDLDPERPFLYLHEPPENKAFQWMYADVSVNGIEVRAVLDTGYTDLLSVSQEQAEELQL